MRLFNTLIFDEQEVTRDGAFTSAAYDELLGSAAEQLVLQFVADNVSVIGNLTVTVQACSDGRNWLDVMTKVYSISPEFGVNNWFDQIDTQLVLVDYIRLNLKTDGPTAHIKIYACGRGRVPRAEALPSGTKGAGRSTADDQAKPCCDGCEDGSGCDGKRKEPAMADSGKGGKKSCEARAYV